MPADELDAAKREPVSLQAADGERTETAPHCPPALAPVAIKDRAAPSMTLAAGHIIDDYEILSRLAPAGFARVYLARQISLNRLVALKVSANRGSEARTLARLEHQHIVQVFAEIVLIERNLRLLCMQFVPGITLERVIERAGPCPGQHPRNGRDIRGDP